MICSSKYYVLFIFCILPFRLYSHYLEKLLYNIILNEIKCKFHIHNLYTQVKNELRKKTRETIIKQNFYLVIHDQEFYFSYLICIFFRRLVKFLTKHLDCCCQRNIFFAFIFFYDRDHDLFWPMTEFGAKYKCRGHYMTIIC